MFSFVSRGAAGEGGSLRITTATIQEDSGQMRGGSCHVMTS